MIIEDVVEPCAVFSTAAITNAMKRKITPWASDPETDSFKIEPMPLDLITNPNAPPAPVINKMIPASLSASAIHAGQFDLSDLETSVKEIANPIDKAITG